jgi:hypothetical protein
MAALDTIISMNQSDREMPLEIGAVISDDQVVGADIQAEHAAFTALAIQLYGR